MATWNYSRKQNLVVDGKLLRDGASIEIQEGFMLLIGSNIKDKYGRFEKVLPEDEGDALIAQWIESKEYGYIDVFSWDDGEMWHDHKTLRGYPRSGEGSPWVEKIIPVGVRAWIKDNEEYPDTLWVLEEGKDFFFQNPLEKLENVGNYGKENSVTYEKSYGGFVKKITFQWVTEERERMVETTNSDSNKREWDYVTSTTTYLKKVVEELPRYREIFVFENKPFSEAE